MLTLVEGHEGKGSSPFPTSCMDGRLGAIEKAVDGGTGPTLYNIEESDIDTLYKSHLSSFVSSCWLAGLGGSGGQRSWVVGQDSGTPHGPHPLAVPLRGHFGSLVGA